MHGECWYERRHQGSPVRKQFPMRLHQLRCFQQPKDHRCLPYTFLVQREWKYRLCCRTHEQRCQRCVAGDNQRLSRRKRRRIASWLQPNLDAQFVPIPGNVKPNQKPIIIVEITARITLATAVMPLPVKALAKTAGWIVAVVATVAVVWSIEISLARVLALYDPWLAMRVIANAVPPVVLLTAPRTARVFASVRPIVQCAAETIQRLLTKVPPQKSVEWMNVLRDINICELRTHEHFQPISTMPDNGTGRRWQWNHQQCDQTMQRNLGPRGHLGRLRNKSQFNSLITSLAIFHLLPPRANATKQRETTNLSIFSWLLIFFETVELLYSR